MTSRGGFGGYGTRGADCTRKSKASPEQPHPPALSPKRRGGSQQGEPCSTASGWYRRGVLPLSASGGGRGVGLLGAFRYHPESAMALTDLVVAVTGASGSAYGVRLLEVLLRAGADGPPHRQPRRGRGVRRRTRPPGEPRPEITSTPPRCSDPPRIRSTCRNFAITTTPRFPVGDRVGVVPHRRHGGLPVQHGDSLGHRPRVECQSDPARGRRDTQREAQTRRRAARDAVGAWCSSRT